MFCWCQSHNKKNRKALHFISFFSCQRRALLWCPDKKSYLYTCQWVHSDCISHPQISRNKKSVLSPSFSSLQYQTNIKINFRKKWHHPHPIRLYHFLRHFPGKKPFPSNTILIIAINNIIIIIVIHPSVIPVELIFEEKFEGYGDRDI